jgi:cysteine desulfurase
VTQAIGKIPLDLSAQSVDALSCSAHKFNGPKGVGVLIVGPDHVIQPLILGGPQEKGQRGGTENVAGIVGMGVAIERAAGSVDHKAARDRGLRDRLWSGLQRIHPEARWNGAPAEILPNTLNVELPGIPSDVLLQALDIEGVAASAGAACHSGSISPSHVLVAMGRSDDAARCSVRLSVGLGVDERQVDAVLVLIGQLIRRIAPGHAR